MAYTRVGSMHVSVGTEYTTFPNSADGMRVNDGVKVSINKTPMDVTYKNEVFKIDTNATYVFEKNTLITLYKIT